MMASRSSQVISSKGEMPGRVKWREKARPVARDAAGRAAVEGAAWGALRLIASVWVWIGFIGGTSPSISNELLWRCRNKCCNGAWVLLVSGADASDTVMPGAFSAIVLNSGTARAGRCCKWSLVPEPGETDPPTPLSWRGTLRPNRGDV